MTISTTINRNDYVGNGATDTYSYNYKILEDSDLLVTTRDTDDTETTLTLTTDYTVTGAGDSTGGTIVLVAGNLTTDYVLTISRVRPVTQTTDIRNQGVFYPETHEDAFDHGIMIDQRQTDQLDGSVRLPETVSSSTFDPQLPADIGATGGSMPITNTAGDAWADEADWPTGTAINSAQSSATAAAASAAAASSSADDAEDSAEEAAAYAAAAAGVMNPLGFNNIGLATSVAANALTIALKQTDGSTDPSTDEEAVTICFRDTTASSGQVTARTVTSALSIVVPSGATLGHNDGIPEYIYIYALDNSGTVELVVSSAGFWGDSRGRNTTALTTGSDDAATLYSTVARSGTPPVRLIGRLLINEATAGTWASDATRVEVGTQLSVIGPQAQAADFIPKHGRTYTVDTSAARAVTLPTHRSGFWFVLKDTNGGINSTNKITVTRAGSENIEGAAANYDLVGPPYGSWKFMSDGTDGWIVSSYANTTQHEIHLDTGNGHGSTNNKIRIFTNARLNTGDALTYATSAVNGDSVTVNEDGVYAVHYSDKRTAAACNFGISVNGSALTTEIYACSYAQGLRAFSEASVAAKIGQVSWTGYLSAGDIIRPHTDGTCDGVVAANIFAVVKVSP